MRLRKGEIMGKNYKLVVGVSKDSEIVEVPTEEPIPKVTKTADFVKGVSSTMITDEFYGEEL